MGDRTFDDQVTEYIRLFPFQETYRYTTALLGRDPARFNTWAEGDAELTRAGEDTIVRTNNDTFYKIAFVVLERDPVAIHATASDPDRFASFQLMDDRNANYRNIIRPHGSYTLYHGSPPSDFVGELIEVPSDLSVVLVRVEVKDGDDPVDVAAATKVFDGISIEGPRITEWPELDLLGGFDRTVSDEAIRRIDEAFESTPFTDMIVGPGQTPGTDVPYLSHAAGTRNGWGGPSPRHSSYDAMLIGETGEPFMGSDGVYVLVTDEPPVEGFWSITAYDTERGGFLHPNDRDRYHYNCLLYTSDAADDPTLV